MWRDIVELMRGATVRATDLQFTGRGLESWLGTIAYM